MSIYLNGKRIPTSNETVSKTDFDKKINIDQPLFRYVNKDGTWKDIAGIQNSSDENVLASLRFNGFKGENTVGGYGAGIVFGGHDTKAVLSVMHVGQQAMITGGYADGNFWHERIAWKSDIKKLEQEIAELKKQIGGVLSRVRKAMYRLFTVKEVMA